jgi:hypothetical protein
VLGVPQNGDTLSLELVARRLNAPNHFSVFIVIFSGLAFTGGTFSLRLGSVSGLARLR